MNHGVCGEDGFIRFIVVWIYRFYINYFNGFKAVWKWLFQTAFYLQLVLNMTIIRIRLVKIETNFMNQLDQLGMRISRIDSAFDQWIKQQNTNYNTLAVLYTLATEGSRTQKYIGEEWSLPKQTVSGTCKTLAEQGLLTFHESEQDKRERLLSLTEQGKESAAPLVQNMQEFSKRIFTAFGEKRAARLFADLDALAELMAQTLNTK